MKKVVMAFAILFGTLAIFAALNRPDYDDPEFWKGCPNKVFNTRPEGPGLPIPTPAPVMLGDKEIVTVAVVSSP